MGLKIRTGDKEMDNILAKIGNMKYVDIKRECALRGMMPELIVSGDFPRLTSWLADNWHLHKNLINLKAFDDWMDSQLDLRGHAKDSPLRQFKQLAPPEPEVPKEEPKKEPKPVKVKVIREKDTKFNIFKGTKKELVYRLCEVLREKYGKKYDNKTLVTKFAKQMVIKVDKKFPGQANEKSIRIWMKRSLENVQTGKTK